MGWKDLLQEKDATTICLPWVGGRSLRSESRTWKITGELPREHGWYNFSLDGRRATFGPRRLAQPDDLVYIVYGYLVGDRIVADGLRPDPDPSQIARFSETVYFIEEGVDRFVRISAGRIYERGPLFFRSQEFPEGPETEVLDAFLDGKLSVDHVKHVAPALDASFRMETYQREEARRRREALERLRIEEEARLARELAEEEARLALEIRREELRERLGDGEARRALAYTDFEEAARAALAIGGADLLDVREGRRGEKVVRYRVDGRRLECVCDIQMRIVDAGICLTDHVTHRKDDTKLSLESLPSVVREAVRENVLVVFRHV